MVVVVVNDWFDVTILLGREAIGLERKSG